MQSRVPASEFLQLSKELPIIDVRSPGEFLAGHIPGASSIPLFTNEERAAVGTVYKKNGQKKAILLGLEYVGPKMRPMIEEALAILGDREDRILVHCWRGGMRSDSVAWLFSRYGLKPLVLEAGYKGYRHLVHETNQQPRKLKVLGGYTGSGKTGILHAMARMGGTVLDLEGLAHHRGSVFGGIGLPEPPTQEQFENNLAASIMELSMKDGFWIEDESRHIGKKIVPEGLYNSLRQSPVYFVHVPFELRIEQLVHDYGNTDLNLLKDLTLRIKKRLGGLDTNNALEAIDSGRLADAARIMLHYYDRAYEYGLNLRENPEVIHYHFDTMDPETIAASILQENPNES